MPKKLEQALRRVTFADVQQLCVDLAHQRRVSQGLAKLLEQYADPFSSVDQIEEMDRQFGGYKARDWLRYAVKKAARHKRGG